MLFGLDPSTIEKIRTTFSNFGNIEKAVIYGSRAKGCHKPSSDIDITLLGDLLAADLPEIEWALDELLLPYKIDISIYQNITNHDLKDHIDRRGIVFYSRA